MNTHRGTEFAWTLLVLLALMIAPPSFATDGTTEDDADGNFTLNLPNADISSLITLVSKKTGKNFIVDPRVKAKVTVISSTPTNADELYDVFLSVLQVHGFAAVQTGDLIKILPEVTARTGPVPNLNPANSDSGTGGDQLVTHVIKLNHVSAAQLVPILRPLVPQQGHLAASPNTNQLVITDRASNVTRLIEIIRRIDVKDHGEVEVIKLSHASASELIRIINTLESQNQAAAGGATSSLKLAADDRTNSLLLSGDQASRLRIRSLVAHLDTPLETGGGTKVVYLKYAKAEDLVGILTGVSQGQSKIGIADVNDTGSTQAAVQQPIVDAQGNVQQATPQPQINTITGGAIQISQESNVDIQADAQTNALIITAPPGEMRNILSVIRQLDIRRAQVMVEAIIAEVSENTVKALGGNLLLDGTIKGLPAVATNVGDFSTELTNIAAIAAGTGTTLGAGLSALAGGEGANGSIGYLLRAISSDSENNILSTPTLVTLDNEEASIVVGSNVPIITSTALSNSDNPFQTIERQDIGILLKITPQINEGDTIKLDIEQEVSQIEEDTTTGLSDIVTSKRTIETSVLVDDGQILVLGGLIDDSVSDSEERVPGLSNIPILGRMFRYTSTTRRKRNLMVFLHPRILRDSRTASYYSSEKYNLLRSQQMIPLSDERGGRAIEQQSLPEFDIQFRGKSIGDIAMRNTGSAILDNKAQSVTQ